MGETEQYTGPERRQENIKLDHALAEVQRLNTAASVLASAVANTAHRTELDDLKNEVKREFQIKLMAQVIAVAVVVIIICLFMQIKFNHMNNSIRRGHDVIACLLGKTEAQRTGDIATAVLLNCTQTVR